MHVWFTLLISALILTSTPGHGSQSFIKSFREWKTERIELVEGRISFLKQKKEAAQKRSAAHASTEASYLAAGSEHIDRLIKKEQAQLALEQDLTVSDYFVGYLTKNTDRKQAFKAVIPKLSAEEIAELMDAYANSVFGTQSQQISSPEASASADLQK